MFIKSIDMCWITVSDIKAAKNFFSDVLKLKITSESDQYEWIEFGTQNGGTALGVTGSSEECSTEKPGSNAIMMFTVDNIEQAKALLQENNITILGDIMELPGHVKFLMFTDADGNKFQFVEVIG